MNWFKEDSGTTNLLVCIILFTGIVLGAVTMFQAVTDKQDDVIYEYQKDLLNCKEDLDKWENRATDNLKLVKGWFGELERSYSYVMFDASDCALITETQQMVCEKNNPLFVIHN